MVLKLRKLNLSRERVEAEISHAEAAARTCEEGAIINREVERHFKELLKEYPPAKIVEQPNPMVD